VLKAPNMIKQTKKIYHITKETQTKKSGKCTRDNTVGAIDGQSNKVSK